MSKERYEKPSLIKHQMGLLNKFGRIQSIGPITHIDGLAVSDLIEKYGSPLFVFSERTMVNRCRELKELLALHYPKFQLAWSYKTNYLDAICRVFDREGSWAEVVSEFEFEKAIRLGVSPSRIIFNGPYKPETALEKGLQGGCRIHIDHFDELSMAKRLRTDWESNPRWAFELISRLAPFQTGRGSASISRADRPGQPSRG